MKLSKLGVDKQANVILGAGASRGASCFDQTWAQSPLDTDFFDQIDRLKGTSTGKILSELSEFARDEFGVADSIRMEPFFTQLEALNEFHASLKIDRGPRVRAFEKQLEKFPSYLAAIFASLRQIAGTQSLTCDHHEALAHALRAGDTVISLNYDCLMDEALKSKSGKSWSAHEGYGVPIESGESAWHDHSGRGRVAKNTIKLLKVHGSLNWMRTGSGPSISLRRDPYETCGRSKSEVVPPVWNKQVSADNTLADIWKGARDSLRTGPILVVVGYSFPDTDLLTQVLLRVATSESGKNLTHLILVNPDHEARRKARYVLHQALTPKTSVIELKSWHELRQLF